MEQKKYDIDIVNEAYQFLLKDKRVTEEILEKHLNEPNSIASNMDDVFFRLIVSLQNANMKANVIGNAITGGMEELRTQIIPSLFMMEQYPDYTMLLDALFTKLKIKSSKTLNEHKTNEKSLWNKYAKSIVSAYQFLKQFSDYKDFKNWVDFFDQDIRARAALPMILSNEIYGLGFALACDFLKEIGYTNFGKPDVLIKDIFMALQLSNSTSDYFVLKDISRIAENTGKTSYYIDKLFWLIGSGKFYYDALEIGNQKQKFINYIEEKKRKN